MSTGLYPRPVPHRRSRIPAWARFALLSATFASCYLLPTDLTTPVSDVSILSDQTTVSVGGTTQLTAVVRDSAGNILPARIVTWTSSNTSIATVAWSGPMTAIAAGMAAGSAVITANSEGVTDTITITVSGTTPSPPPPSGGLTNECASPQAGWIWCDDFEQDRLASYFEYVAQSGSFSRVSGVGAEGSYGMRARFAASQVDAGNLKLAFGKTPQTYFDPVDAGTAIYRDIYWRVYVKFAPGWTGGGGDKMSRATSFASSTSWAQAMIAHVWSGSSPDENYLVLDPASGTDAAGILKTTTYNDFPNLRWLGAVRSATPIFDSSHVGPWYCFEVRARLNDPGLSNGVFELWIDGQLDAQKTGLNWVGSFSDYGINALFIENYWNGGSPQAQERYFDNLVVSTQPIGC